MFSCFVIRQERENEWDLENPFLLVMAHVHLSYLICFTERMKVWVLCFKIGALKLTVVFSPDRLIQSQPLWLYSCYELLAYSLTLHWCSCTGLVTVCCVFLRMSFFIKYFLFCYFQSGAEEALPWPVEVTL